MANQNYWGLGVGLLCWIGVSHVLPSRAEQAIGTSPIEVIAQSPTPSESPQPESPAPKLDAIAQRLIGQWKTRQPIEGDMLTFIFAPDGKCFLILNSNATAGQPQQVREIRYRIDSQPKPAHLDFVLSETETVQTVFEFVANGDLRLQLTGTNPGQPRAKFNNATLFEKVSDSPIPPQGEQATRF
jgi:hypothetical protein